MRAPFFFLLLVFGALFEWWWTRYLAFGGVAPGWMFVAVVALAAVEGPVPAQILGFGWGLFADAMSLHLFGANILGFCLFGYAVGRGRRLLDLSNALSQGVLVAILSAVYALFLGGLGWVFFDNFLWPGWRGLLAVPLANGIAAPFLFGFLERRQRRTRF